MHLICPDSQNGSCETEPEELLEEEDDELDEEDELDEDDELEDDEPEEELVVLEQPS